MQDTQYNVKPNAELGMGFSWGKYFSKGQYLTSLKVGYEFQQWWDQWEAKKPGDSPLAMDTISRGDLAFNGLVVGLSLDF